VRRVGGLDLNRLRCTQICAGSSLRQDTLCMSKQGGLWLAQGTDSMMEEPQSGEYIYLKEAPMLRSVTSAERSLCARVVEQ